MDNIVLPFIGMIMVGFWSLFIWGFFAIIMIFVIANYVFTIFNIIDCYKRDFKDRTLWLVLLVSGLFLGYSLIVSLIYHFIIKNDLEKDEQSIQ